jgi:hypothetical protein
MPALNLFARTAPLAPPSLSDKLWKYFGFIWHQIGIGCKFFSVAFVADPEYQREVKCTYSHGSHVTRSMTRWFFTSIWMWSKAIQQLFLPIFLVSSPVHLRNHADVLVLNSSTIAKVLSPFGKTFKELKSPSSVDVS